MNRASWWTSFPLFRYISSQADFQRAGLDAATEAGRSFCVHNYGPSCSLKGQGPLEKAPRRRERVPAGCDRRPPKGPGVLTAYTREVGV